MKSQMNPFATGISFGVSIAVMAIPGNAIAQGPLEHIFRVTGGAHTFAVWQRYLNEVAPVLFQE